MPEDFGELRPASLGNMSDNDIVSPSSMTMDRLESFNEELIRGNHQVLSDSLYGITWIKVKPKKQLRPNEFSKGDVLYVRAFDFGSSFEIVEGYESIGPDETIYKIIIVEKKNV